MARIAIAGFLHETNTFSKDSTGLSAFIEADAWPGLVEGSAIVKAVAGSNIAISGFIEVAQEYGYDLVPLVWASANPSGLVEKAAFETIVTQIIQELEGVGPIDAVFLDLHGAMVTEHLEDGEGELLARLRAVIGDAVPIVVALDFHANVSPRMVELADACVVYRTYPHVDIADTGRRAAAVLEQRLSGKRLYKAYRKLPFLIPMLWQCTLIEPFKTLMQQVEEQGREHDVSAAIVPGFPLADCYDCGPTVLVYGIDAKVTEVVAQYLYEKVVAQRHAFGGKLYSSEEAVAVALASTQPLILADTQDNPGGGGTSDTTDLLHELMRQDAQGVCMGLLCDPTAAEAAHAAGIGAKITLALGGHGGVGASPLVASYTVEALGNGQFTGTGPFYLGCRMDLGPMARLSYRGIQILVSSRKQQAADQSMFRHLNCEPNQHRILVLKSSVHFRADFGQLGREILMVAAPGVNSADLRHLKYRKLREGVALL